MLATREVKFDLSTVTTLWNAILTTVYKESSTYNENVRERRGTFLKKLFPSNAYYALKVSQLQTSVYVRDKLLPRIAAQQFLDVSRFVFTVFQEIENFVQRLLLTKELLGTRALNFVHEFLENGRNNRRLIQGDLSERN